MVRNKISDVKNAATNEAKRRLLESAKKDVNSVLTEYRNTEEGYDDVTADEMREKFGRNIITKSKKVSIWNRIFRSFVNPFTVVLAILAIVSLITSSSYTTAIVITIMVTISGLLRFVQEARSGKAIEKLTEMVETVITVFRKPNGKIEIPMDELVVGDVIRIAAGDIIPADVRIIKVKDFFVSQSSLTGESEPVEKFSKIPDTDSKNPLDYNNLAFMGTTVVSGSALAVVISVGDHTIFGNIAQKVKAKKAPTSFEKGISSVSWLLIRFMAVMVPVVFFIVWMKGWLDGNPDTINALVFALSVAVGLTPEMLPMIVSANLAKGAMSMSKKQVIVKDLNSIQNFGAMDVLCTDKTGTITQDKVILQYHLNIHGNEDIRVLRHAFLNSYYQTGMKNLMDLAIIEYAEKNGVYQQYVNYKKVDEIPFDFNRRRMTVVVENETGKTQLITKGAIEEMLSVCDNAEYNGKLEPLTSELKNEILNTVKKYNSDGVRVLGVAHKNNPPSAGVFSVNDEIGMTLIGYVAFLDPPKESAHDAIATLNEYGVCVKVLTGDNDAVTMCVCRQVGIKDDNVILGSDIEEMNDDALGVVVEKHSVFAKLSPDQKSRIVVALRKNGHTVGFMGDGINDASAMKAADVGISVDTAVDIAKESANIILLEKDLMILKDGVVEGRKVYANTIKYIKMTASSNFGNMFSVLIACAFLPFLPMLSIQILTLNLIYDASCIAIPWDNVDEDYIRVPRKWNASSISKFMMWIGPTSSIFDLTTYGLMFFIICPMLYGPFDSNSIYATAFALTFATGWFVESLCTQTFVIHMIRTPKIPFIQSRASLVVFMATICAIAVGISLPYTPIGPVLGMEPLPWEFYPFLILIILSYMVVVTFVKRQFVKKYGELL